MNLVWIGETAVEELGCRRRWSVHSLFESSANLRLSEDPRDERSPLIHVGHSGVRAPFGFEIDSNQWPRWRRLLSVGTRSGVWDPETGDFGRRLGLSVGRDWSSFQGDSSIPLDRLTEDALPALEVAAGDSGLLWHLSHEEVVRTVQTAASDLLRGDLGEVRRLLGRGPGLTPSGDDVIVGILAAFCSRSMPGYSACGILELASVIQDPTVTTAQSRAYLMCAAAGRFAAPIRNLFMASNDHERSSALVALRSHGHTSGADTILGLAAGVGALADRLVGIG